MNKAVKFAFVAFKTIPEAEKAKVEADKDADITPLFADKPFINVF